MLYQSAHHAGRGRWFGGRSGALGGGNLEGKGLALAQLLMKFSIQAFPTMVVIMAIVGAGLSLVVDFGRPIEENKH